MHPLWILAIGVVLIVGLIVFLRANAFLALLIAALTVSFLAGPPVDAGGDWVVCVSRVAVSLGTFAGKIGIIIMMGAIIGSTMMYSGAADRIVQAICRLFGEKRVPAALLSSGFVLSIPVFYDTTLFLLIPLARSVYKRVGKNYLLYLTAIGAGATITHVLVPPTPGPLAIADKLHIPLSTMFGVSLLVGICMAPIALAISYLMNRLLLNPTLLDDEEDTVSHATPEGAAETADPPSSSEDFQEMRKKLPSLGVSLVPLALPLLLIAGQSIFAVSADGWIAANNAFLATIADLSDQQEGTFQYGSRAFRDCHAGDVRKILESENARLLAWKRPIDVFGKPEIALLLGALFSMGVLLMRPGMTFREMQAKVDHTLLSGGLIVLITASGGAFGDMLKIAGAGEAIAAMFRDEQGAISGTMILLMSFVIAALIKTAQGSSTTAMITTAGIIGAMNIHKTLDFNVAYVAVAIGCGSIVVGWMNDSGFWAFCRMGRISEIDALKTWTIQLGLMGCAGVMITILLSRILPLLPPAVLP